MICKQGSSLFVGNLRVFSPSVVTHGGPILPFCPTAVLLFFFPLQHNVMVSAAARRTAWQLENCDFSIIS